MHERLEELKNKLRDRGYKLTPQRIAIYDVIVENADDHLSTEDVYHIVKRNFSDIGLATVYRTLILFNELGVITKLDLEDGCIRYELKNDDEDHHHHHLICTKCGKIIEVDLDLLDELEDEIEAQFAFQITNHKLKFYGICQSCQQTL